MINKEQKYLDLIGKVVFLPKKFCYNDNSLPGFYVIVEVFDLDNNPMVAVDRDFITIYGEPGDWNTFSADYIFARPHNKGVVVL